MFCPTCGKLVSDGLKFCNSCGAKLTHDVVDKNDSPGKMLDNILTTLFLVVMFGLGILVGLVAVMLQNSVKTEVVVIVVLAYLAVIFGICFSLARQVPKLIDARLKNWSDPSGTVAPPQLTPLTTAQLEEYRQPVASVTDHTTKTLDKVPFKGN